MYIHGADAYEKKDWNGVVQNMEESLASYLQAEDDCSDIIDRNFAKGRYPDFNHSIASK